MTANEIYQHMLLTFAERTGQPLDGGCDLAVRLYAAAAELETLYQYADWTRKQAFPQTATGAYLDFHGQMHGLTRRPQTQAHGALKIRLTEAQAEELTLAEGSILLSPDGIEAYLDEDVTVAAGVTQITAAVTAAEAGAAGNLPMGTRFTFAQSVSCIDSAVAQSAFTGGAEAESDEAYRARILACFRPGGNGANADTYRELALGIDRVAACSVIPYARGPLTMDIVLTDRDGEPLAQQLAQMQALVNERRELGVDIEVSGPQPVPIDVEITLRRKEGVVFDDARAAARSAVRQYFTGRLLGTPVYDSALNHLVFSTGLVEDCAVDTSHAGEQIQPDELPVLGDLIITEAAL